jgi:hypothetical protein
MRLTDELDHLILSAVGDDFMTLEFIADKLLKPAGGIPGKLDAKNLQARLLKLISNKLINAYLLHADPPFITPIEIGHDALPTSWFYITQRGRKCLSNLSGKQDRVLRRGANSRGDKAFTPAINF